MSISQLLEALKDTNVSLTISEKLLAGVSVAVLSMVVVFIVLVLISGIISLLQKMENNNKKENKSLSINNIEKETEITEIEEEGNFEEVVAAITAAICAANGGKKICVKKIIRTNNTKSNWESMYKNITK